jgi:hypothetical protein
MSESGSVLPASLRRIGSYLRASSAFALARSRNRRVQLATRQSSFSIVSLDSRLIIQQNAQFYRRS